jgi:hypothetical protein
MADPKILYKYVSADVFQLLWGNETIRFTQLNQLNDPYENRIIDPNIPFNTDKLKELSKNNDWVYNNMVTYDFQLAIKQTQKVQDEFDNNFGVLSLTRNPSNLLMWAHYADQHKGVVVGIDVSNPIFFENGVIINPEQGNVIYSSIKPRGLKTIKKIHRVPNKEGNGYSTIIESNDSIPVDSAFLYKGIDWFYEEEVRIVRDFNVNRGVPSVKNPDVRLFPFPKSLIKTVIFGVRYDPQLIQNFMKKNEKMDVSFLQASIDDYEYKVNLKTLNKSLETEKPIMVRPIIMKGQMLQGKNNKGKKKK